MFIHNVSHERSINTLLYVLHLNLSVGGGAEVKPQNDVQPPGQD